MAEILKKNTVFFAIFVVFFREDEFFIVVTIDCFCARVHSMHLRTHFNLVRMGYCCGAGCRGEYCGAVGRGMREGAYIACLWQA